MNDGTLLNVGADDVTSTFKILPKRGGSLLVGFQPFNIRKRLHEIYQTLVMMFEINYSQMIACQVIYY